MNFIKLFLFVPLFIFQTSAWSQQKEFNNDDIKVNLPKIDIDSSFTGPNNLQFRLIQSDSNSIRYSITISKYDKNLPDLNTFYQKGFAAGLKKLNAEIVFEKDTIINGFTAKTAQFSYDSADGHQICNALIFAIKDNLYIIRTIYFQNSELDKEYFEKTKSFFDSVYFKKSFEPTTPIAETALTWLILLGLIFCVLFYFKTKKNKKEV